MCCEPYACKVSGMSYAHDCNWFSTTFLCIIIAPLYSLLHFCHCFITLFNCHVPSSGTIIMRSITVVLLYLVSIIKPGVIASASFSVQTTWTSTLRCTTARRRHLTSLCVCALRVLCASRLLMGVTFTTGDVILNTVSVYVLRLLCICRN